MVLKGDTVGSIKRIKKAKVVVIVGGLDTTAIETKGTVLIHSAEQEGALDANLNSLPKYTFQASKDNEDKPDVGAGRMVPVESNGSHLAIERVLLSEDADCCICLSTYEDGAELNSLPCNHHFHATRIVKWLKMNATCPLCKYHILKGNEQV